MNKEEVINMKPGRDLDIKVALEVMGYIWMKHLIQFSAELAVKWLGTAQDLKDAGGVYTTVAESQFIALKERENFAEAVLHFSTKIEDAEQVVQRMKERGYEYQLESKVEKGEEKYGAYFYKKGEQLDGQAISSDTVPEAIVKAALAAIDAMRQTSL